MTLEDNTHRFFWWLVLKFIKITPIDTKGRFKEKKVITMILIFYFDLEFEYKKCH